MALTLRYIGLAMLAGLAWIVVAETAGWIPDGAADAWIVPLGAAGVGCLALGLLLSLLSPVGRIMQQGKCTRCRRPIERGQTYCRDHLQAAVNECRDHLRDRPGRI